MSMIPVPSEVTCAGKIPTNQVLEKVEAASALAGLGWSCEYDKNTGELIGCNIDDNPNQTTGSPTIPATQTDWGKFISDMGKMGLTIAGQAYLNDHQAKVAQYGPNGSVIYQASQIPASYFQNGVNPMAMGQTGAAASGGMMLGLSTTTMLLIGGGVLLVVMLAGQRR